MGGLALRAQQLRQFGQVHTLETTEKFYVDEKTGLRLRKPNSVHGKVHGNALGFRGPDIEIPTPSGTVRIAFLGSSTTYDPYVANDEMWAHRAWDMLQASFHQCQFDYVNAGIPGAGTKAALLLYDSFVERLEPDIVVLRFGDIAQDAGSLARKLGVLDGLYYQPSWVAERSLLWAKVEKNLVIIQRQRGAFSEVGKLQVEPSELSGGFGENFTELVDRVQKSAGLVVLETLTGRTRRELSQREQIQAGTWIFYMPYLSVPSFLDLRDEYTRVIAMVADETGGVLLRSFESVPTDFEHYADELHLRAPGNKIVATNFIEGLRDLPALKEIMAKSSTACASAVE